VRTLKRGLTLTELLVALALSLLIVMAVTTLHEAAGKGFAGGKVLTDAEEEALAALSQLEWLFQRWGVGTPCCSQSCTVVTDCGEGYPPPSSLCVTIKPGGRCDEVTFYASLGGMGFVDRLLSAEEVALVSCRLSTQENCYHLRRGGLWAPVDWDYESYPVPPAVAVKGLSPDDASCAELKSSYNATALREVELLNGTYRGSTVFTLESGDLLISVPYRVTLFCKEEEDGPWLYARLGEPVPECGRPEKEFAVAPVESFRVTVEGKALRVRAVFRGSTGGLFSVERVYGR